MLETEPLLTAAEQRFRLLVLLDDRSWTFALPEQGSVTIGRADDVDVQLADPSISRRHTRLHLGGGIRVEDLGSANGTRWRGEPIPANRPVTIQPGDPIEIGHTLLVVQRAVVRAQPPWLLSHQQFQSKVNEQCSKTDAGKTEFAVLRLSTGTRSSGEVQRALEQLLRGGELAALPAPGLYDILLPVATEEQAQDRADELRNGLEAVEDPVSVGIGCFPRDAKDVEGLLARASRGIGAQREVGSVPPLAVSEMEGLKRIVERVAQSNINVLISGETGVGKGVLASDIHRRSGRSGRPFVAINCAELQETLLESELFGHERGAFTGAKSAKAGLIETAEGGTLFLDEIGEMSLATQAKLLRVLEERSVRRVGSLKQRPVDIRLIAASNRDLERESERGTFRRDLYFRLNGISLLVPPLRERVKEIETLATGFIALAARDAKRDPPVLSREALRALLRHRWPGNVRELHNVLDRALVLCAGDVIAPEHLSLGRSVPEQERGGVVQFATPASPAVAASDRRARDRERIIDALEKCAGNQSRAAKLLGISRATLVNRLDVHGVPRPRKPVD